ncbi:MAG: TerC family protein [Planctomycetes bacterium]|nr:TerC family protein [Planctomycetota bacterium]
MQNLEESRAQSETPAYAWVLFISFVLLMLIIDLGIIQRKAHVVRFKEALFWTIVWISMAIGLGFIILSWKGTDLAIEYITAYLIEESLSVDNIFVFVTIFSYFRVPDEYRHRVLFFGILGAIILRGIFISVGIVLISEFDWILYVFGAILFITGVKLTIKSESVDVKKNPILKIARKFLHITPDYHQQKFFITQAGKIVATPLFLVLIMIETTDIIFAIDSIPAVFGVTRDPFIAFTSNIMAILGLRAMYFLLENLVDKFSYLRIGIAVILMFVGIKMLVGHYLKIPPIITLSFMAAVLIASMLASVRKTRIS